MNSGLRVDEDFTIEVMEELEDDVEVIEELEDDVGVIEELENDLEVIEELEDDVEVIEELDYDEYITKSEPDLETRLIITDEVDLRDNNYAYCNRFINIEAVKAEIKSELELCPDERVERFLEKPKVIFSSYLTSNKSNNKWKETTNTISMRKCFVKLTRLPISTSNILQTVSVENPNSTSIYHTDDDYEFFQERDATSEFNSDGEEEETTTDHLIENTIEDKKARKKLTFSSEEYQAAFYTAIVKLKLLTKNTDDGDKIEESKVFFQTQRCLHQGIYKAPIIPIDENILGCFVCTETPESHNCSTNNLPISLIRRKSTNELTVNVQSCVTFPVKLEGVEVKFEDDFYVTPLIPMGTLTIQESNQEGKLHCCLFCKKFYAHLGKHLEYMHKKQPQVKQILDMPKKSSKREKGLEELRFEGDCLYNSQVNPEDRIRVRKLQKPYIKESTRCSKCKGFFSFRSYSRHKLRCTGRDANQDRVLKEAQQAVKEEALLKMLSPLRKDPVTNEILSDFCLRLLSETFALTHTKNSGTLRSARQQLRRMARLLWRIREIDPTVTNFEDCILYGSYDAVIEAVYRLCELDADGLKKNDLAKVIRPTITHLLNALEAHYRENLSIDSTEYKKVMAFQKLHWKMFAKRILRSAERTHYIPVKKIELPEASDIKLFAQYICQEAREAYKSLTENNFDYNIWVRLGEAELLKLIIYNRRRVTEVAAMSLELFKRRSPIDPEQIKHLNAFQKLFANQYAMMHLVCKSGHYVLLDEEQCVHIEKFLEFREMAGVSNENDLLFGIPTSLFINASSAIKEFSEKCGAKKPHLLRTSYLSKYVATLSQLLNLKDSQFAHVVSFMGYSQKICEKYREDPHLFQIAAWAKFLTVVTQEEIYEYRDKNFEQILDEFGNPQEEIENDVYLKAAEIEDCYLYRSEILKELTINKSTTNEVENRFWDLLEDVKTINMSHAGTSKEIQIPTKQTLRNRRMLFNIASKYLDSPKMKNWKKYHYIPKKTRKKNNFGADEVKIMKTHFAANIRNKSLPAMDLCQKVLNQNKAVFKDGRCYLNIYYWVHYQIKKRKNHF